MDTEDRDETAPFLPTSTARAPRSKPTRATVRALKALLGALGLLLTSLVIASIFLVLKRSNMGPTFNGNERTSIFAPSNYSIVDKFFIQSQAGFDGIEYDLLEDSFGLLDKSKGRWSNFMRAINKLNRESNDETAYKVIFAARHGQGEHNAAESKYGTEAWDCKYSMLYGDDELTWGPDPLLTKLGVSQAQKVNIAWKREIENGIPLPTSLYSSPLRRSAETLRLTWHDILLPPDRTTGTGGKHGNVVPRIKENLREVIGLHTCDKRSTKSVIAETFPSYTFDPSFTEQDQLWNADYQEKAPHQALRTQLVLNEIFATDPSPFISITAHSGTINSLMTVTGHNRFGIEPGGFIPMVVKAVGGIQASQSAITAGQSATKPACAEVPVKTEL